MAGYLSGGVEGLSGAGDEERVGGINTTCGLADTVIGVMLTVLRRAGDRGGEGGSLGSSPISGLGSRKEAGGMKAGLPR